MWLIDLIMMSFCSVLFFTWQNSRKTYQKVLEQSVGSNFAVPKRPFSHYWERLIVECARIVFVVDVYRTRIIVCICVPIHTPPQLRIEWLLFGVYTMSNDGYSQLKIAFNAFIWCSCSCSLTLVFRCCCCRCRFMMGIHLAKCMDAPISTIIFIYMYAHNGNWMV